MTPAAFRKLALSMPEAHEAPHFERTSFRVGKKIFATLARNGDAMVPVRPLMRCFELLGEHPVAFYSFGGWTQRNGSLGIHLSKADARLVGALLKDAWRRIAPRRLQDLA